MTERPSDGGFTIPQSVLFNLLCVVTVVVARGVPVPETGSGVEDYAPVRIRLGTVMTTQANVAG
jgi:hypothetical protein